MIDLSNTFLPLGLYDCGFKTEWICMNKEDELPVKELVEKLTLERYSVVKNCRLKPSKIHGLGVFAKRLLDRGQIITMYPCDCFEIRVGNGKSFYVFPDGEFDYKRYGTDYKFQMNDILGVIGNPEKNTNPSRLGHMANAFSTEPEHSESVQTPNASIGYYDGYPVLFSLRRIRKGQEILWDYGTEYDWQRIKDKYKQ